ncbi:unnamed protein product [Symbiodinium sp. CCMP2592]|nr:unnamed protein product [Symbiodinium sp. CCMP2592]
MALAGLAQSLARDFVVASGMLDEDEGEEEIQEEILQNVKVQLKAAVERLTVDDLERAGRKKAKAAGSKQKQTDEEVQPKKRKKVES